MSRYDNRFRQKVINYLKSDKKISKTKVIKIFQITRQTLYDWIELDTKGELLQIKPKKNGFTSSVDLVKLKTYLDSNPDKYYSEIAKNFSVGTEQIRILVTKKLGYTSKKTKYLS